MKATKNKKTASKSRNQDAIASRTKLLVIVLSIIAVVLVAAVCWVYFSPAPQTNTPALPNPITNVTDQPGEILFHDVFVDNWNSTQVSVLGIRLGMTDSQVLAKLGPADRANEYDFGAERNWEYGERLGLSETGVTYHIEKGFVTRIIVFPAMNTLLHGNSVVNKSLAEVYTQFGIPQRQYDIKTGRFFVYNPQGFEVYLTAKQEASYAFVFPMRKLPSTAVLNITIDQNAAQQGPKPPRLMLDTTTLCDQGKTFAYNPVTKDCKTYANACVIPDTEIEVKSCSAQDTTLDALKLGTDQ